MVSEYRPFSKVRIQCISAFSQILDFCTFAIFSLLRLPLNWLPTRLARRPSDGAVDRTYGLEQFEGEVNHICSSPSSSGDLVMDASPAFVFTDGTVAVEGEGGQPMPDLMGESNLQILQL